MFRRIYRVVLRTYDEADATREIKEDWHRDAKGSERLGRVGFCDALFELADMWTAGICPYEYAAFRATTAPPPPLFLRLSSSASLPPPLLLRLSSSTRRHPPLKQAPAPCELTLQRNCIGNAGAASLLNAAEGSTCRVDLKFNLVTRDRLLQRIAESRRVSPRTCCRPGGCWLDAEAEPPRARAPRAPPEGRGPEPSRRTRPGHVRDMSETRPRGPEPGPAVSPGRRDEPAWLRQASDVLLRGATPLPPPRHVAGEGLVPPVSLPCVEVA